MRFVTFLLIFMALFSFSNAQEWLSSPYLNENSSSLTFYDYQNAFKSWAEGKDISNVKGVKPYKRWEWFMSSRTYPNGQFPDPAINWKEWEKFQSQEKDILEIPTWLSIAPVDVPQSADTASTDINGMGRINCITFHPTDPNTLFIGASQGGVWKSTDDGDTWVCLTDYEPILRVSSIAVDPNDPDIMYIATGDIDYVGFPTIQQGRMVQYGLGVMKTTNGGATWYQTGLSFELTDEDNSLIRSLYVNGNNSDEIIAAGPCGIYKSYDAGATWNQVSSEVVIDLEINQHDYSIMYASTIFSYNNASSKRILKTYDFGDNWEELDPGFPASPAYDRIELALSPSDTSIIYALISGGPSKADGMRAIYKSTDAGTTWNLQFEQWNVLGWFGGTYITNKFYDDNEMMLQFAGVERDDVNMDTAGQGSYDLTLIVDPNDPNKVYSGGVNMWGSIDGGVNWDIVSLWIGNFGPSVHADQHYSVFSPHTGRFYQANDGGIFKTDELLMGSLDEIYDCIDWNLVIQSMTGGGGMEDMSDFIKPSCTYEFPTQWDDISGGLHITEYYRFANCRSNSDMMVGGSQDNGTYMYHNGSWQHILGGDGMEAMIDHNNDSIIYATNYNGALSRSIDRGVTWESSLESDITGAGESGDWVTPFVMHPIYSDTIYAGFQNVWVSGDKGTTWTQISDFGNTSSIRALTVAASDANYIYAYRAGAIFGTKNGGANWTNITGTLPNNFITYIAVDETNPEIVWVTMSGFEDGEKVFKSTDAGANWINISGNLPNVSVNCIVFQDSLSQFPTKTIYVGTDIGVYFTTDELYDNGSQTWHAYNNGLPAVIVNELEIHYGSKKLRAATYGRGFWETDLYNFKGILSPDFYASETNIYQGDTIQFFDASQGSPDTWFWTFQGGTLYTSAEQNPTNVVYQDTGSFDVHMVVTTDYYVDTMWKQDYIIVSEKSAVEEIIEDARIRLYPNPAKDFITIKSGILDFQDVRIRIFNELGEIQTDDIINGSAQLNEKIDISEFAKGVYIVQLTIKDSHYTTKFVKE